MWFERERERESACVFHGSVCENSSVWDYLCDVIIQLWDSMIQVGETGSNWPRSSWLRGTVEMKSQNVLFRTQSYFSLNLTKIGIILLLKIGKN